VFLQHGAYPLFLQCRYVKRVPPIRFLGERVCKAGISLFTCFFTKRVLYVHAVKTRCQKKQII
jgi:hypothetical protein